MQATPSVIQQLDQLRTAQDLYQKMQVMQHQRAAVQASGLPALRRLASTAQGNSGQSAVVGRFLLGLYNGPAYPFTLTELRALDQELHSDCMAVLMMDWSPEREVHEMIQGGHHIFQSLIARWGDRP
ncbi:MAG: hypothetical protein V7756_16540 [Halopseudomonas sp.]|uniref:DUF7673 family protein n=1 Tax=Halopseudomonas sp. TaxID=2901191 RepID=UPI003002799C